MADAECISIRVDPDVEASHRVPVTIFAGAKISSLHLVVVVAHDCACALCKLHAALCQSLTVCILPCHLYVEVSLFYFSKVLIAFVLCAALPGHTAGIAIGGIWT